MKSSEINLSLGQMCQDFIDVCPHCEAKVHLELLHNDHYTGAGRDQFNYLTFRCKPCKKLSVRVFQSRQNPYSTEQNLTLERWISKFPPVDTQPGHKIIEFVPKEVVDDYTEGLVCLANGAAKAAVSMFRRAIQSAVIEQGADKEQKLSQQIKSVGSLTKEIKDWAHNIRIFGNWGAHPQDDKLSQVDQALAEEVKDFIEEFMNYVYVLPGKVSAARRRHEKTIDDSDKKGQE
jgi:hypothetical protein